MEWYIYLARFFAGAFLANTVPHFVSGVQGRPFPSPFASPPERRIVADGKRYLGRGERSCRISPPVPGR